MLVQAVEGSATVLVLLASMAWEAEVFLVAMEQSGKQHRATNSEATPRRDEPEAGQGTVGAGAARATSGWILPRDSALTAREPGDPSRLCWGGRRLAAGEARSGGSGTARRSGNFLAGNYGTRQGGAVVHYCLLDHAVVKAWERLER